MAPCGYAASVRRDFLTFPDGWSGLALVVLRLSLAGVLAIGPTTDPLLPPWAFTAGDCLALALTAGVLTRLAAALAIPAALGAGIFAGGAIGWLIALHGLDAFALALLGAGAYSIDAKMFGRHVFTLDE